MNSNSEEKDEQKLEEELRRKKRTESEDRQEGLYQISEPSFRKRLRKYIWKHFEQYGDILMDGPTNGQTKSVKEVHACA
jgi:hypothetical protein